jgi:hypothetical protein
MMRKREKNNNAYLCIFSKEFSTSKDEGSGEHK